MRTKVTGLAVCLCLLLGGCQRSALFPIAREISDFELMSTMALDVGEDDPENVLVSLTGKGQQGPAKESGGSEQSKPLFLTGESGSITLAIQKMQTYIDKFIFLGHLQYCLVGEDAAREDMGRHLDYIMRDPKLRTNSKMFVVRGSPAYELIQKTSTSKQFITDRIHALEIDANVLSVASMITVADAASATDEGGNYLVPGLELVDMSDRDGYLREEKEDDPQSEHWGFDYSGYAIIKENKLVGFLDNEESQGVVLLKNKAFSDIIEQRTEEGTLVALRIRPPSCSVTPVWQGAKLETIKIDLSFVSMINEIQGPENIFVPEKLEDLSKKQSAVLKENIERVCRRAQEEGCDFLGLGDRIAKKSPNKFDAIKENWKELFPQVTIEVTANSKVANTYDINKPNGAMKEE